MKNINLLILSLAFANGLNEPAHHAAVEMQTVQNEPANHEMASRPVDQNISDFATQNSKRTKFRPVYCIVGIGAVIAITALTTLGVYELGKTANTV